MENKSDGKSWLIEYRSCMCFNAQASFNQYKSNKCYVMKPDYHKIKQQQN